MRTFSSRSPWQRAYAAASSRGRRRSRFRCPHTFPGHLPEASVERNPRCGGCDAQFARIGAISSPPNDSPRDSSSIRSARSSDGQRSPARGPTRRARRGAARARPSGRARGTGRSVRTSAAVTRTRRRRSLPGSGRRTRSRWRRVAVPQPVCGPRACRSSPAARRCFARASAHVPSRVRAKRSTSLDAPRN